MALEVLYQNAHFTSYVKGMHDPKEYQTVELLENIFNKVIFRDNDDVFVNSQQPPGMHSNKACDIVIKYTAAGSFKTKILCFVECKRSKKTNPYDLREVENQARQYCEEYLASDPGLPFVYVCTACGTHLRLWKYERGSESLQGFWGSFSPAAWGEYKDVGIEADAKTILLGFDQMLALGPELREGQDMHGYGSLHAKQPPHQGLGGSHHKASATPREVNATVYESQGQQAVAFSLDGQQLTTWLSDWSKAQTPDGRPLWFLKSFNYGLEFTEPALFTSNAATVNISVDPKEYANRKPRSITICRPKPDTEFIYCFHLPCWLRLRADLQVPMMKPIHIYSLALSVTPLRGPSFPVNPYTDGFTLSRALNRLAEDLHWKELIPSDQGRRSSDLTNLLRDIWTKLPVEIVSMIWMYLQSCPTRSLISITAGGAMDLLEKITPCKIGRNGNIILHDHVSVHLIRIKGAGYVCGLDDGKRLCGHRSSTHHRISLTSPIVAVTFTLGLYGIRRIQFHGQDGSLRSVGDQSYDPNGHNWAGIIRSQQAMSYLQLWWDGLKLYAIDRLQADSTSFGDRFLWDCDYPISAKNVLTAEMYYTHPRPSPTGSVCETLAWTPVRHLPLQGAQSVLYGITLFCASSGGIVGMGAHFRCDRLSNKRKVSWTGRQTGCPIHFRLKAPETITSVWVVHHRSDNFVTPFIIMKTSEGRIGNFGPYIHPSNLQTQLLATQAQGKISGIYYDASRRNLSHITSFGVYCCHKVMDSGKIDVSPQSLSYRYPPSIRGSPLGIFLSRASLSDIRGIETCSIGSRCTGMMITYTNGTQEVLGQWYESLPSRHTIIYATNNEKSFEKVHFKLSYESGYTVLREVTLLPVSGNFNGIVKDVSYGDTIIWWYSQSSDVILSETENNNSSEEDEIFTAPSNINEFAVPITKYRIIHAQNIAAMSSATTFYDFDPLDKKGDPFPLSSLKGKVVLVVNTASKCGFTPQFKALETLYTSLSTAHPDKFTIIGFPCNQFGSQDPGSNDEIQTFCSVNYGVTFPVLAKVDVNGDKAAPLWKWLEAEKPGLLGLKRVKWNFEKFLIGADGKVVERWSSVTKPESLKGAIEKEIAKIEKAAPAAVAEADAPKEGGAPQL
ncbi:hypothetical protein FQN51_009530 [Onygenales sp. PD_10]|nr:hypothetical protein FQN51_009530 [Onygenales sp. PD_10]